MNGLYRPGTSVLHRLPAGAKVIMLLLAGVGVIFLDRPGQVGVALLVIIAGYLAAGLGWRTALRQLRPLWLLLVITAALHVVLSGWLRAVVVTGVIMALVLLAALVTCTTKATDLLAVAETAVRPLQRFGVPADRLGLVLALGLRSVAVVGELAAEIRDAQRARGLSPGLQTVAAPLVVRSLRHADRLADALVARGLDD